MMNLHQKQPVSKHKHKFSAKKEIGPRKHVLSETILQKDTGGPRQPGNQYSREMMAVSKQHHDGSATNSGYYYTASMADPRGQFNDSGHHVLMINDQHESGELMTQSISQIQTH